MSSLSSSLGGGGGCGETGGDEANETFKDLVADEAAAGLIDISAAAAAVDSNMEAEDCIASCDLALSIKDQAE